MLARLHRTASAHWPLLFPTVIGLILLAIAGVIIAVLTELWVFLPLAAALILLASIFYSGATWFVERAHNHRRIVETIWEQNVLQAEQSIALLELGQRETALGLMHHLSKGQLTVVDLFNPQLMPNPAYLRIRAMVAQTVPLDSVDRRVEWVEGSIDVLPFPDRSVAQIVVNQVLSAMPLETDRTQFLKQVYHALAPNGSAIFVEAVRDKRSRQLFGIAKQAVWQSVPRWQQILTQSRFEHQHDRSINAVLHCFVVKKPISSSQPKLPLPMN